MNDVTSDEPLQISINTTHGGETKTTNLTEILAQARKIMQSDKLTFCGSLSVEYVQRGEALPFLGADLIAEELVLSGDLLYKPGTYDSSFIRLKYELSEDVKMDIPIRA